jgi:tryptophan-rich sensory protein
MKESVRIYLVSVFVALGTGATAAYFTSEGMQSLYASINTPRLSPPSDWFPPVWTLLYFLMGLSAGMVWQEKRPEKLSLRNRAIAFYGLSLFVNFSWCFIFFSFRSFGLAFVWLLLLFALVVKTVVEYRKLNSFAAYLQIPYLLWLIFAGYLSCSVWLLN